eukprot:355823-Chlamydomonas_euryale.AAC.3
MPVPSTSLKPHSLSPPEPISFKPHGRHLNPCPTCPATPACAQVEFVALSVKKGSQVWTCGPACAAATMSDVAH